MKDTTCPQFVRFPNYSRRGPKGSIVCLFVCFERCDVCIVAMQYVLFASVSMCAVHADGRYGLPTRLELYFQNHNQQHASQLQHRQVILCLDDSVLVCLLLLLLFYLISFIITSGALE